MVQGRPAKGYTGTFNIKHTEVIQSTNILPRGSSLTNLAVKTLKPIPVTQQPQQEPLSAPRSSGGRLPEPVRRQEAVEGGEEGFLQGHSLAWQRAKQDKLTQHHRGTKRAGVGSTCPGNHQHHKSLTGSSG